MLETNKVYNMDCLEGMKLLDDNSIDTILTDPPYEIGFMSKDWDSTGIAFNVNIWKEALRVAKPGAMLMAFGGAKSYHRMVCAIEDAGWEIRDCMMWLYGSGFPKSYNISKGIDKQQGNARRVIGEYQYPDGSGKRRIAPCGSQTTIGRVSGSFNITAPSSKEAQEWSGYGSALKPAYEPIVLAMKPIEGGYVDNALKYGVAGLNIDGTRIDFNKKDDIRVDKGYKHNAKAGLENGKPKDNSNGVKQELYKTNGRWPANIILDEEAGKVLDEQTGDLSYGNKEGGYSYVGKEYEVEGFIKANKPQALSNYGDSGGASRFFYCSKVSSFERNYGCEKMEKKKIATMNAMGDNPEGYVDPVSERFTTEKQNFHPTVKPISVCSYLARLTKMPSNGIVLDPFSGSGSTLIACMLEGRPYIGFEKEAEYIPIIEARIKAWTKAKEKGLIETDEHEKVILKKEVIKKKVEEPKKDDDIFDMLK